MFEVSKEHQVSDFSQYFLRLADTDIQLNMDSRWEKLHRLGRDEEVSWKFWQKQYSFRDQYGVGLDPEELQELWIALQRDPGLLRTYVSHMFSQTVGNYDYFDYICDMRYLSEEKNDACSARGALLESPPPLELRRAIGPTSLLSSKSDADAADTNGSMHLAVLAASLTLNLLLGSVVLLMARRRRREEAASYVALP